jgi:hypothetical protein
MMAAAPHALAAALEALAPMLQTIAPMLQALALTLPLSPAVLVPAALQPLAVSLPTPSLLLHPISLALETFPPTVEAPALVPTVALVTGMPAGRVPLGTLDRKGVGLIDLGSHWTRRPCEAQCGSEGERRVKTCHAFLPAAGPRGSKWSGTGSNGRVTRKWSGR